MKTAYFENRTMDERSDKMLLKLARQVKRRRPPFKKVGASLIVLDMQRYFLEKNSHAFVPSAPAVVPSINSLISIFRSSNRPVVFTRHVNAPSDAGSMARWWKDLIAKENPLSEIIAELATTDCPVVEKSQYDAFYETSLDEYLRQCNTEQVIICGVLTHLCCESTARSAFSRGFDVFFTIDGTATYNEDFHMATLLNLSHGFATPLKAREIMSFMENVDGT